MESSSLGYDEMADTAYMTDEAENRFHAFFKILKLW